MKFFGKPSLIFAIGFLIATLYSVEIVAQNYPDKPNPPRLVNDFANVLSEEENTSLENKLVAYNDSTSTQIAIVTITDIAGYPVDQYTFELGNRWGIGQKGKSNGILILVAVKNHKAFIATGYGMEGALNDGKVGTILRQQMIPYFKQNDYYSGFDSGIDAMIAAASGEYVNENPEGTERRKGSPLFVFLFIIFIIIIIIISKISSTRRYARMNNVPFWVAWSIVNAMLNKGHRGGGGFFGGGSGFGGGGGGGFGGFGGGSFGGGGAGGSW